MEMNAKVFILTTFCVFLRGSDQNPMGVRTLLPHILVVQVDGTWGQLLLSCLNSTSEGELEGAGVADEGIFWMHNGLMEPQRGNSHLVHLGESLGGGNYTCHGENGSLLNYTVVLIEEVKVATRKILVESDRGGYLSCSARNYNGDFRCSWSWHPRRVGKVAFVEARRWVGSKPPRAAAGFLTDVSSLARADMGGLPACSPDPSGALWSCSSGQGAVTCSVDDDGNGISCRDERHCPYGEEIHPIHVAVQLRSKHFLVESYHRRFFLSDIVKPDKVGIRKVNATTVAWSYPSTWNGPFSYFPLAFEVARLKDVCKSCDDPCAHAGAAKAWTASSPETCQLQVKQKVKAVCIRAKDALSNSQWGEWSFFRLKRGRKNRRKGRKSMKKKKKKKNPVAQAFL